MTELPATMPSPSPTERRAVQVGNGATRLAYQVRAGQPVPRVAPVLPVGIEPSGGDVGELQRDCRHRTHHENGARGGTE